MKKLEESLQIIENKAKGKDHVHKNLQEKIKELEGQIELKTSTQNQSEKQISQLCEKLKGKEETCCTLQQKVAFYARLTCGSSIYFLVTSVV
jgi:kinesin family protein C2/C3